MKLTNWRMTEVDLPTVHQPLLHVQDLRVRFDIKGKRFTAVDGVSFDIAYGEKVGLVGESGSGKSVTGLSLTRLGDRRGAKIDPDSVIRLAGGDVVNASDRDLRRMRRSVVSTVFQDPLGALNPMYSVGWQIAEAVRLRADASELNIDLEVEGLLSRVGLSDTNRVRHSYPHQLSGGMRQRIMIAIALASKPKLIVADEPTTALDATVQKHIIELLNRLVSEEGISTLFVSHDLTLVASFVDRVMVMYAGRVVEHGAVEDIFNRPQHPYTRALLRSAPRMDSEYQPLAGGIPGAPPRLEAMPAGCRFHPRCDFAIARCREEVPTLQTNRENGQGSACHRAGELLPLPVVRPVESVSLGLRESGSGGEPLLRVHNVTKSYRGRNRHSEPHTAVDGVSVKVFSGDTLGIVGESGSGKSTLGLLMAGLELPHAGEVSFGGRQLSSMSSRDLRHLRRYLQIVFQDATASLDPRLRVSRLLAEPLKIHGMAPSRRELHHRLTSALERVGLSAGDLHRYPGEFSGGQRQRIAIARALTLEPSLLILDEPVSSLDVSVQAEIVSLLRTLQGDMGLTYVFISHDLALVRNFCNRVAVMSHGAVVEHGEAEKVLSNPQHDYTRELISSMPIPLAAAREIGKQRSGLQTAL